MVEQDEQRVMRGVDEYWAMVSRRKWWIIGPLFFGWLLVFLSAWVIPATYTSESVILVEGQKVPENYVVPNVEVDLSERLQSIEQQVLSRTRLLNLIERLKLYPAYSSSPDDQVLKMREDINLELVQAPAPPGKTGELVAFKIDYQAPTPQVAQQVNTALAGFFIDENVRASQEQSVTTTQFLDAQAKAAGATLQDMQSKVRAYEAQHEGVLPQELQSNIQILQSSQQQLNAAMAAKERAVQQMAYLTSLQQQYQAMGADGGAATPPSIDQQLEAARAGVAALRARYTDEHPDVKKAQAEVVRLEALKKDMSAEAKENVDSNNLTPQQVQAMAPMVQLQSQMKALKMEIQTQDSTIRGLEQRVMEFQKRVALTPQVEAEMSDMMRDFGSTKKSYAELLAKKQASALATNLEQQQQGEQFRIIDPPSLPDKPSFPDRFKFSLAAVAVGLVLAVVFGAGMELVDDRIRSEADLNDASTLPVLVEIPPLPTDAEIRRARWSPWIAAAATLLVCILIPSGIAIAYYWG